MTHRSYFQVNIQSAYCTGYLNLCFSQQNSLFCKLQDDLSVKKQLREKHQKHQKIKEGTAIHSHAHKH